MSGEHREYVDLQDAARQQINLPGLLHEIVFVVVVVFYLVRLMARVLDVGNKDVEQRALASRPPVHRGSAFDPRRPASQKTRSAS
jgi:hypothetical protein